MGKPTALKTEPKTNGRTEEIFGKDKAEVITISPPNLDVMAATIVGTAPYVQCRFGQKAIEQMKAKQMAGSQANKGRKRDPKDFQACYKDSQHVSVEGWHGIPASAFRDGMIGVCRLVGFKMTHAKFGVFILADGFDVVDGTPLVKISKGECHYCEHAVRNETGVADIRARAMWDVGWEAVVRIQFDADMFSKSDVVNLLHRMGVQGGVGEGRASSRNSAGVGWGFFSLKS